MPFVDREGVPQPFLYAGYVYDRELAGPGEASGWYWLSVRHYDPQLKRFLQPDPSEQEGVRSYVYAGDDPLDLTDPSGLVGICIGGFSWGDCSTNPDPIKVAAGVGLVGSAVVLAGLAAAGDAIFPPSAGANPGEAAAVSGLVTAGLALVRAGVAVSAAYGGYTSSRVLISSGSAGGGGGGSSGSPDPQAAGNASSADPNRGPVTFRPPPGATREEIAQCQEYVAGCNDALQQGQLSPTGRLSTTGALRRQASRAAAVERARAAKAGQPYTGHAGHVPDTTWTGNADPPGYLDLSGRVNTNEAPPQTDEA